MWPFYKLLPDLPRPPQKFFDEIEIDPNNLPIKTSLHEVRFRYVQRDGRQFFASPAARVPASDKFIQWVKENIVANPKDVSINFRHYNSSTGGIHTDTERRYRLAYIITNGGDRAGCTWWQEDGKPLIRDLAIQHLAFDDVKPVCEFITPTDCWFIMDSSILHSAENIEGPRVQFDISLNSTNLPEEWLKD